MNIFIVDIIVTYFIYSNYSYSVPLKNRYLAHVYKMYINNRIIEQWNVYKLNASQRKADISHMFIKEQ